MATLTGKIDIDNVIPFKLRNLNQKTRENMKNAPLVEI
jgi:hypothetical protein